MRVMVLSLPGCLVVGELWNWAISLHLSTNPNGTASFHPRAYPSGSLLTPLVLYHSSISALFFCWASYTLCLSRLSWVLAEAMNIAGGRRVMCELSFPPWSALDGLDSMSGAV